MNDRVHSLTFEAEGSAHMSNPWWIRPAALISLGGLAIVLAMKLDLAPVLSAFLNGGQISVAATVLLLAVYTVLLATPFVPGAELGLAILVLFGASMALPVYLATVLGLSLAFALGGLAARSQPMAETGDQHKAIAERWRTLRTRAPLRSLKKHRALAVIVLINTPGNSVLGGGGGIAFATGYSRSFRYPLFLGCIAVAVAPVPAVVLVADALGISGQIDQWLTGLTASAAH